MDREKKECDHRWIVVKTEQAHVTEGWGKRKKEYIVKVPVYQCRICGRLK